MDANRSGGRDRPSFKALLEAPASLSPHPRSRTSRPLLKKFYGLLPGNPDHYLQLAASSLFPFPLRNQSHHIETLFTADDLREINEVLVFPIILPIKKEVRFQGEASNLVPPMTEPLKISRLKKCPETQRVRRKTRVVIQPISTPMRESMFIPQDRSTRNSDRTKLLAQLFGTTPP